MQPVRKGHHRAGEAERDQWKGCSAQPKDWINPEAARADDNKWQLIPKHIPSAFYPQKKHNRMSGLLFVLYCDEIMSLLFRGAEKRYPDDTSN